LKGDLEDYQRGWELSLSESQSSTWSYQRLPIESDSDRVEIRAGRSDGDNDDEEDGKQFLHSSRGSESSRRDTARYILSST
jgi:hypothetical protein